MQSLAHSYRFLPPRNIVPYKGTNGFPTPTPRERSFSILIGPFLAICVHRTFPRHLCPWISSTKNYFREHLPSTISICQTKNGHTVATPKPISNLTSPNKLRHKKPQLYLSSLPRIQQKLTTTNGGSAHSHATWSPPRKPHHVKRLPIW